MEYLHKFLLVLLSTVTTTKLCYSQRSCQPGDGLVVMSDDNFGTKRIFTAPIPSSSSASDFCDLTVNLQRTAKDLAFDNLTGFLFWEQSGSIRKYPIFGRDPPDSTILIAERDNHYIRSIAIDESGRRLFWSEQGAGLIPNDHSIWYVPLDGDESDKVKLYQDNRETHYPIEDIDIDGNNQIIYFTIDGEVTKANIDITRNILTNIQTEEGAETSYASLQVDSAAQKVYWTLATCEIKRIDVADFGSGTPESFFDGSGSCGGRIREIMLSVGEDKLYYNDGTKGLYELPLSGTNHVTSTQVLSGFPGSGYPYYVILIPKCPLSNDITFTSSQYTAYEGDNKFFIEVRRTSSSCVDTSPSVRVINYEGTATRPEDYSFLVNGEAQNTDSLTIQLKSGDISIIEVPFEIHADDRSEGNETFIIELSDVSPYESFHIGQISRAVVTIVDKSSYFQFKESSYEVIEGNYILAIGIERIGYLQESAQVSLVTSAGTATPGIDYDPIILDVVFGPYEAESQAFISIKDDHNLETTETTQVAFAKAQSEGLSITTISIKDNDSGYSFKQSSYEFSEGVGEIRIPVERIGATDVEGSVHIDFSVIPGDTKDREAIHGEDYTEFNPALLTFTIGESIANIYIYITDDDQYERSESFQVTISNPQPAESEIVINKTVITILDNEENIRFSENTVTVREGDPSPLRIPIIRSVTQEESRVLVSTCQILKSAVAGKDYVPIDSAAVRFLTGQTTVYTPDMIIINDSEGEDVESFRVVVASESQGPVRCNEEQTNEIYVNIIDDDGLTYRFSTQHYTIQESSANLKVTIYENGIASSNLRETLFLSALSGSAEINQDFVFNNPLRLNFGSGNHADVLIQIVSDSEYEGGEMFNLHLINSDDEVLDISTVTIQDDDLPPTPQQPQTTYYFSDVVVTVSESETSVKVKILRSQSAAPGSITLDTISGSAEGGADFYPLTAYSLYFSPGTVYVEQEIGIIDDKETEEQEFFQVSLSSPTDGGSIATEPVTITINDNDENESGSTNALVGIIAGAVTVVLIFGSVVFICLLFLARAS